jgi:hypothetical protein
MQHDLLFVNSTTGTLMSASAEHLRQALGLFQDEDPATGRREVLRLRGIMCICRPLHQG